MIKNYSLFLFVFLFSFFIKAQIQTDSVVVILNQKYTIHKVQTGETLANLGRLYNVPFAQMKAANPDYVEKLSVGDFIKIPHLIPNKGPQNTSQVLNNPTPKYIKHIVVEKETLYGITRKYKISTDSIFQLNPDLQSMGLHPGMEINVGINPKFVKQQKENKKQAVKDVLIDKIDVAKITHQVEKKETIFSITQKYSISENDFLIWNPMVKEQGLKIGQIVTVGINNTTTSLNSNTEKESLTINNFKYKDTTFLSVLVMLPFKQKNIQWDIEKKVLNDDTQLSIEFYNGFLLALDTLKKLGLNIKVKVIDTSNDTVYVRKLIEKKAIGIPDLIIGPIYTPEFKIVAQYAKKNNITIINPLGKNEDVIKKMPNSVRLRPDNNRKYYATADYLVKKYTNQNIIIAYETGDLKLAEKMKVYLLDKNSSLKVSLAEGIFQPLNLLNDNPKIQNIVWVLNEEESFPSRLVNKLYTKKAAKIEVYGTEEWVDFKNIEVQHWDSLHIHISGTLNYLYHQREFKDVMAKYFNKTGVDMSFYAMMGFDAGWISLKPMIGISRFNISALENKRFSGMMMDYYFSKSDVGNGLKNSAGSVYKYQNYKFTKVH